MANIISPTGAQDYVHQGGSQRTEELQQAWVMSSDVTPIFNGDLVCTVQPVSSALLTGGFGNYVTQGTSQTGGTVAFRGVFRGCEFFNPTAGRMQYQKNWPGATIAGTSSATGDVRCYVVTDGSQRFIIQASSIGIMGSSMIGNAVTTALNGTLSSATASSAAGNTVTGLSGMQIASSLSVTITSTGVFGQPFRLVDFLSNNGPGNPLQGFPGVGSSLGFVNGMDNTTVGQVVIVEPLNWESRGY